MKVIDQINGSALFAHSAYSAAVATKDDLGRDITATYLTAHQSLDGYATTSELEQVSAEVTNKLDTTAQVISSCETSSINGETLVTKLNGNEIAVEYAGSARIANIALKDYQGNSFVPFYAKTSALEEKLDTTAFSTVSGDFLTTSFGISESATWNEVSETVQSNSAQWAEGGTGGDIEVNAYVHNNSASIDGTTSVVQSNSSVWSDITAYQSNSASYLTAHQSLDGYATTTQVNDLSGAIDYVSANVGVNIPVSNSGDLYKVEFDSVDLYGYKTTTDIPDYSYSAVSSQESTYLQYTYYPQWNNPSIQGLRNWSAFDVISISSNGERIYSSYFGDNRLTALDVYYAAQYVYDYNDNQLANFSGYIGKITLDNLVISSYFDKPSYYNDIARVSEFRLWFSANHSPEGNIESKYITSVGKVLSGVNSIEGIFVMPPSALPTYEYDSTNKISAINGSAIAAGDEFPVSADEAVQYVQSNSAQIDDTVTSYQTNSGRFLTAHQAISAEEWNSNYETVNTNSGAWGGSALPISAGPGIKVNLVDNTLMFSNDETVLWEDNTDPAEGINGTKSINETVSNFENIDVYFWRCSDHSQTYRYYQINRVPVMSGSSNFATFWQESTAWFKMFLRISGTTATFREGHYTNAGLTDTLTETNMYSQGNIFKIVGINRIGG